MTYEEKLYNTKNSDEVEFGEKSLEEHLEIEHSLRYYLNCLDFLGYDTLELIHALIHQAYFEGFADGLQINNNPNETKSVELYKSRILKEYPFSDFSEDCAVVAKLDD